MRAQLENEAALVMEAQHGNSQAFTALVHHYGPFIYRLALNIMGNRQDAERVLQRSFLENCSDFSQCCGTSSFYARLVRTASREMMTVLRGRRSGTSVPSKQTLAEDEALLPEKLVPWSGTPERCTSKMKLRRILRKAMENLEPASRLVVMLRDTENFSTEETAQLLNLPVPEIRFRLLRGRLKLRNYLDKYFKQGRRH